MRGKSKSGDAQNGAVIGAHECLSEVRAWVALAKPQRDARVESSGIAGTC